MKDIAELIGWVVIFGFGFVMMNFVLKYLNKVYISKLPPGKKNFTNNYRKVMRFFIKYHKVAGIILSLLIIVHLILMSVFVEISVTGILALSLMLSIFLLGLYGAFINKNFKGTWLKIHRFLAFVLILSIAIHLL